MKLIHNLTLIVIGIIIIACNGADGLDKSTDFTKENEFTGGIEGPAVDANGLLYAVNFGEEGTIGVVDQEGIASLFTKLPKGSTGNGIRFDQEGHMYIADYTGHNVLKIAKDTKEAVVFAHDSTANQPNDLAIAPNGMLFASDPDWANSKGQIWRIEEGQFHLLETDMGTTNGIEVDPTGTKLYVNESVQRQIWVYDLNAQGEISNKQLFYKFDDFGMDGMRCDTQGNLYVCRYDAGKVVVLNTLGEVIREVLLKGKKPSNIAFGGKDNKQCFVTLQDRGCFETFTADYPGRN